jgi:hypothetical protein
LCIWRDSYDAYVGGAGRIKIGKGHDCIVELPDGRLILVEENGSYRIGNSNRHKNRTDIPRNVDLICIEQGRATQIEMADGSIIHIDKNGSYRIDDSEAEVVYKANRIREFNRYMNASDILEEFIRYVGGLGVKQGEVLNLPISLFINFLIIRASEEDGDAIPEGVTIENHPALATTSRQALQPHCRCCGRFIKQAHHKHGLDFCSQDHMLVYVARKGVF